MNSDKPYICQACNHYIAVGWRLNQNPPHFYGRFTLCPVCAYEVDTFIFAWHNVLAEKNIEVYRDLNDAIRKYAAQTRAGEGPWPEKTGSSEPEKEQADKPFDPFADPQGLKIYQAFSGPRAHWRTLGGIARQTGISIEKVESYVHEHPNQFVRGDLTVSGTALYQFKDMIKEEFR